MKKEDNNKKLRLFRYGYLSNTVYFVPDDLSLTIRVDSQKRKIPPQKKANQGAVSSDTRG